jgi:hypothetical protein
MDAKILLPGPGLNTEADISSATGTSSADSPKESEDAAPRAAAVLLPAFAMGAFAVMANL